MILTDEVVYMTFYLREGVCKR